MKNSLYLLATLLFVMAGMKTQAAGQSLSNGAGDLRVMTYNVNEGTDFLEVQSAGNSLQFLVAVGRPSLRCGKPTLRNGCRYWRSRS